MQMQRHIPLGYRMIDGKIDINSKNIKVVKQIFSDYLKGSSIRNIAQRLVDEGVLNSNSKYSWSHSSVGRILENTKYLGDEMYPQIIDKETFKSTQNRRKSRKKELGMNQQIFNLRKNSMFNEKLRCGECGDVYRQYITGAGKPEEKIEWKCKKHFYKHRTLCRNLMLNESDIENMFISATNKLLSRIWMLDKEIKKEPPKMTLEIRKLEEEIKELEEEEEFSSKELAELIFKRAKAYYKVSKIDDYDYNTKNMKEALIDKELSTEFNEDLFIEIVSQITIYKDGKIEVEYINGIIMEADHEKIRKDE